jgi:hypothetical protein
VLLVFRRLTDQSPPTTGPPYGVGLSFVYTQVVARVVVSIPTYGNADTLHRAVTSVLGQTMGDLTVVVSNDAGPVDAVDCLADVRDPRLTVVHHDRNRGRYWCDTEVLRTCDAEWFTVVDADDWVEPDWLESMLAVEGCEVVLGPHTAHGINGKSSEVALRDFTGMFTWHAHMGAGIYSTEYLRRTGLLSGALRVGWDNIVTGFPYLSAAVGHHYRAAYHRVRREGSLTESHGSGMRSAMRQATVALLRGVWDDLRDDPWQSACIIGSLDHERTAGLLIRQLPSTPWAMQPAALAELDAWLWRESPRVIVECGSGLSTVIMGNYAKYSGARVVSLDHDRRFATQTAGLLSQHNLSEFVDLRTVDLAGSPPMYQTDLPDGIEFVLIDGPPEATGGREATLDALMPHMAPRWSGWLDDASRPLERAALKGWRDRHKIKASPTNLPHSPVVIRPSVKRARRHDASDVTVAILTGHRPDLLARTLSSVPAWLLGSAHVVVLHDGADEATTQVLDGYRGDIDRLITRRHPTQMMHTIGDNWSHLAEQAQTEFFLTLEDDWQYVALGAEWLSNARDALREGAGQVRLRSVSETVLDRHMATRAPISWSPSQYGWSADAHFTTNPSLVRSSDLPSLWPADGERHMQRRAVDSGLTCVVQANPGAWIHIGEHSMREQLQPPS